jgi:hypothetical protein
MGRGLFGKNREGREVDRETIEDDLFGIFIRIANRAGVCFAPRVAFGAVDRHDRDRSFKGDFGENIRDSVKIE